jgi:L-fucose isomerase
MKEKYPKIGIRPIIDGRRKGIRESLEETTLNMNEKAEKDYLLVVRC